MFSVNNIKFIISKDKVKCTMYYIFYMTVWVIIHYPFFTSNTLPGESVESWSVRYGSYLTLLSMTFHNIFHISCSGA